MVVVGLRVVMVVAGDATVANPVTLLKSLGRYQHHAPDSSSLVGRNRSRGEIGVELTQDDGTRPRGRKSFETCTAPR
jgi:hypothetical protein